MTRSAETENVENKVEEESAELPIIESSEKQLEIESTEAEEPVIEEVVGVKEPAYSYTDLSQTMYASQSVNLKSLPSVDREKLGELSSTEDVTATKKCNKNGWYRIQYHGGEVYVSGKHLQNEKLAPVEKSTSSSSSQSSGGRCSYGSSVTFPTHEDTVENLVWIPTKGGKKYHSKSSCSSMEGSMQVTMERASTLGYTACKRCH